MIFYTIVVVMWQWAPSAEDEFILQYPTSSLSPEDTSTSSLRRLLFLVTLVKGHSALMVSSDVVKILDLVDSNDPILTRECFIEGAQLRTFGRQL